MNVFLLLILFAVVRSISSIILIPEEVPSLLSIVYSNIPPVLKGTDSRLGIGFRLGPNADFQYQIELGPQTRTKPIGPDAPAPEASKKRHAYHQNQLGGLQTTNDPPHWIYTWNNLNSEANNKNRNNNNESLKNLEESYEQTMTNKFISRQPQPPTQANLQQQPNYIQSHLSKLYEQSEQYKKNAQVQLINKPEDPTVNNENYENNKNLMNSNVKNVEIYNVYNTLLAKDSSNNKPTVDRTKEEVIVHNEKNSQSAESNKDNSDLIFEIPKKVTVYRNGNKDTRETKTVKPLNEKITTSTPTTTKGSHRMDEDEKEMEIAESNIDETWDEIEEEESEDQKKIDVEKNNKLNQINSLTHSQFVQKIPSPSKTKS